MIWLSEVDFDRAWRSLMALKLELPEAVWNDVWKNISPILDFADQSMGDGK